MIRAETTDVGQTKELAAALAPLARAGDVILLGGDLGAGKTAFAQGFAAGLGVSEAVTSPTFTLARSYTGRLRLNHLDVYRLDHLQEAIDLGLAEMVDDAAVTLIEWGQAVAPTLPSDFLDVRLVHGAPSQDENHRRIEVRVTGPGWSARQSALIRSLGPWAEKVGPC